MNKNYDERVSKIDALLPLSSNNFELHFRKTKYDCPIIEIPQEYLIYRLNNTRTKMSQREFIADNINEYPEDFFSSDRQEDLAQQTTQHNLLTAYVDSNLKEAFDHAGSQTEPLIVNPSGVVINGNRRLCFMRNANFLNIRAAVVNHPSLEGKEKEIEASEDIVPDAKKEYDWISRGLDLLELRHAGMDDSQIAIFKGIKIDEIKLGAGIVELANEYLEFIGAPNKFSRASLNYQLFRERYSKQINEVDSRANDLALFSLIHASDEVIDGRKYNHIKDIVKYPKVATEFFSERFSSSDSQANGDPLGETLPIIINEEDFKIVLQDSDATDELAESFVERLAVHKANIAGAGARKQLKQQIRKAATAISSARILVDNPDSDNEGISSLLDSISDDCNYIKGKI